MMEVLLIFLIFRLLMVNCGLFSRQVLVQIRLA